MTEVYVANAESRKGRTKLAIMPGVEPSASLLPDLLRTLADGQHRRRAPRSGLVVRRGARTAVRLI